MRSHCSWSTCLSRRGQQCHWELGWRTLSLHSAVHGHAAHADQHHADRQPRPQDQTQEEEEEHRKGSCCSKGQKDQGMWSETRLLQFLPNAVQSVVRSRLTGWQQMRIFCPVKNCSFGCNNGTPCICDLVEYVAVGLKITLLELHPYFPMLSIHAQCLDSITYFFLLLN